MGSRDVFVIHGRDERLRSGMFAFLRSLALNPLQWSHAVELTGTGTPYVGEILDTAFTNAQAVVVLLTPDDIAMLRPDLQGSKEQAYETNLTPQARPNVLFEAGMAMARQPNRTIMVEIGELRPFSDVAGRHSIRMDNSSKKRNELAARLKSAGCPINLTGTDWQTAGDLTLPQRTVFSDQRGSRVRLFEADHSAPMNDWIMDDPHWHAFDRLAEICVAPKLLEPHSGHGAAGWEPKECLLQRIGDFPNFPKLDSNYSTWYARMKQESPAKLKHDGAKYTLVNHPDSETDCHTVVLEVMETKWSRVQACHELAESSRIDFFSVADPKYRGTGKPRMDLKISQVPHTLTLKGLVVTEDQMLLAIQRPRPERTDYFPNVWSFSFEEQLAEDDFKQKVPPTEAWLHRSMRQEILGSDVDKILDVQKCRLLAVALEEFTFNSFVVAYIPVSCDSKQLAKCLPHAPDRAESANWQFFSLVHHGPLLDVFVNRQMPDGAGLHPSARYRIYLALSAYLSSGYNVAEILLSRKARP